MTEEEAKQKWCPHIKEKAFINGDKCIASDCMMWRVIHNGVPDGQSAPREYSGYCGLGGKP